MRAKARIDRKVDRVAKAVSVNIVAEPGPQFRFGKLTIEGLDVTTEPVVRKLWSVKPGAPFNADYPDYFLTQLREEGYFENLGKTQSKVDLDEENRVADVTYLRCGAGEAGEEAAIGTAARLEGLNPTGSRSNALLRVLRCFP